MIVSVVVFQSLFDVILSITTRRIPAIPLGQCRSNADCNEGSPHCSDFGYCQWTDRFGSHPVEKTSRVPKQARDDTDYLDYADYDEYYQYQDNNYYDTSNDYGDYRVDLTNLEPKFEKKETKNKLNFGQKVASRDSTPITQRFIAPMIFNNMDTNDLKDKISETQKSIQSEISTSSISSNQDKSSNENKIIQLQKELKISPHLLPPHVSQIVTKDEGGKVIDIGLEKQETRSTINKLPNTIIDSTTEKRPQSSTDSPSTTKTTATTTGRRHNSSQCPGGSLKKCVTACQPLPDSSVYRICLKECIRRCPQ